MGEAGGDVIEPHEIAKIVVGLVLLLWLAVVMAVMQVRIWRGREIESF